MIHSMTGFGRASGTMGGRWSVVVTVRSVNHKYLETSVRLPEALWEFETAVRQLASEIFARGKVDISLRAQRTTEPEYVVRINRKIANGVIPELRSMLEEFGGNQPLSIGDLMRLPDLVQIEAVESEWEEGDRDDLRKIVRQALDRVVEMRAAEGIGLRDDIEKRLAAVEAHHADLESQRDAITREALESYRTRVVDLARVAGVEMDQDRLIQETVLMVEKSDVAEELTRMTIHLGQAKNLIRGNEPAGKKLDFLAQEILREINTLGQKSRSATIRSLVVELKTEVERIREQVQNVE